MDQVEVEVVLELLPRLLEDQVVEVDEEAEAVEEIVS